MNKKSNNLKNTGNWIGVGTAIGSSFCCNKGTNLDCCRCCSRAALLGRNRKLKIKK